MRNSLVLILFMVVGPVLAVDAAHKLEPDDKEIELTGGEVQASESDSDIAKSFAELSDYVNLGDTVFVTAPNGDISRAQIQEFGTDRIHLVTKDGAAVVLSEDGVREMHVQYTDPIKNGAFIGGAIGGGIGVGLAVAYPEGSGDIAAAAIFAGIGLGIGAGFDALHKGRRLVYEDPSVGSGTQVSLYPILTKHRKGIGVSVRF